MNHISHSLSGQNRRSASRGRARMIVIANLGRTGRIQQQIRRAFIANGGKPLSTLDLVAWAYPAGRKPWSCHDVRRAAFKYAVQLGPTRPVFWAPKA
jgi:hypothetical protein